MTPLVFSRDSYKHGLRCMECERRFEEGDAIAKRLTAVADDTFVTETVCALCPIEGALTA